MLKVESKGKVDGMLELTHSHSKQELLLDDMRDVIMVRQFG